MADDCPNDPPMPPGYSVWRRPVTPAMQQWAYSIVYDKNANYGDIFQKVIDGQVVVGRLEHHHFTVRNGEQIPGCFRGCTLYEGGVVHVPASPAAKSAWTASMIILGIAAFSAAFATARALYDRKHA